jgi:hypothetical protein
MESKYSLRINDLGSSILSPLKATQSPTESTLTTFSREGESSHETKLQESFQLLLAQFQPKQDSTTRNKVTPTIHSPKLLRQIFKTIYIMQQISLAQCTSSIHTNKVNEDVGVSKIRYRLNSCELLTELVKQRLAQHYSDPTYPLLTVKPNHIPYLESHSRLVANNTAHLVTARHHPSYNKETSSVQQTQLYRLTKNEPHGDILTSDKAGQYTPNILPKYNGINNENLKKNACLLIRNLKIDVFGCTKIYMG